MDIPENKETAKYYLVDYDSVGQNGLDGIENLTPKDRVFIFYTGKENTMQISSIEKIYSCRAEIIFQKDLSGYSLPACTGYIAGKYPDAEIHIISNCKEFKTLNKFYADEEFNIFIQQNISGVVPPPPPVKEIETPLGRFKFREKSVVKQNMPVLDSIEAMLNMMDESK